MSTRAKWIWAIVGVIATALLAWLITNMLGLAQVGGSDSGVTVDIGQDGEAPGAILCSSQETANAVAARVFARARDASADPEALSRLESDSLVRLDRAELTEYNEAQDFADCSARLVIELPRGTEPAFGYSRRLRADIDFVVRGGSGAIERLERADMVITDLSAADLSVRDREYDDPYSNKEDPIGALIEDIQGDPEDRPDRSAQPAQPAPRPRPQQGPPADGAPVDLLPPEMEGQGQRR